MELLAWLCGDVYSDMWATELLTISWVAHLDQTEDRADCLAGHLYDLWQLLFVVEFASEYRQL